MKKNKLLGVTVIIFTICCLLFFVFKHLNLYEKEIEITDFKTDTSMLLDNIYFENQEYAYFYSNTIEDVISEKYNYYNIYWLLSIDNFLEIGIKEDVLSFLETHIISGKIADESQYRYGAIYDIYLRAGIEKNLNLQTNTDIYLDQLYSYYHKKENFFFVANYKEFDEGIQATNLALQVMTLMETEADDKIINDIYQKHLKLLDDKHLFNINDINLKRDLISREIVILDTIRMCEELLNLKNTTLPLKLDNWIHKVVSEYNKYVLVNKDMDSFIYNASCYLTALKENYNLNIEVEMPVLYVETTENFVKDYFLIDPQFAYEHIYTYMKQDKILSNHVYDYMVKNYKLLIYENIPAYNLKEIYFGIELFELQNINFNKTKLINLLQDLYSNNDSHIYNIEEIYYLEKICGTLNIDKESIPYKKEIKKIIDDLSFKISEYSPKVLYYLSYIVKKQDYLNNNHINEEILVLVLKNIENLNSVSDAYYSYETLKLLEFDEINVNFLSEINKFKRQRGYVINSRNAIVDISSTYLAFKMMVEQNQMTSDTIAYFQEVIENFRIDTGGYFIFLSDELEQLSYSSNFSLESMYYGHVIDSYLNNIDTIK